MNNYIDELLSALTAMKANMPFALTLIAVLWLVQSLNWLLGYRLNLLGIYPRSWHGLLGVFFSPFLHGDFNHLFFNSIPLLVMMSFVMLFGMPYFYCLTTLIIVISGLAVWLFGRRALHVGASSLIMGYFGFLLTNIYYQPNAISLLLTVVIIYYFGGSMLLNLFATEDNTSWEGHIFGFLAGIAATYLCPYTIYHFT